mmetsp:Transcript_27306/g.68755  ORF Transcript_27306/g.68755 Transcript_27306/m.68755 type:complete len:305 (+) Transcript_27306:458-1372(+)
MRTVPLLCGKGTVVRGSGGLAWRHRMRRGSERRPAGRYWQHWCSSASLLQRLELRVQRLQPFSSLLRPLRGAPDGGARWRSATRSAPCRRRLGGHAGWAPPGGGPRRPRPLALPLPRAGIVLGLLPPRPWRRGSVRAGARTIPRRGARAAAAGGRLLGGASRRPRGNAGATRCALGSRRRGGGAQRRACAPRGPRSGGRGCAAGRLLCRAHLRQHLLHHVAQPLQLPAVGAQRRLQLLQRRAGHALGGRIPDQHQMHPSSGSAWNQAPIPRCIGNVDLTHNRYIRWIRPGNDLNLHETVHQVHQ